MLGVPLGLGVRSVLVISASSFDTKEDEEDDGAYQRNKADEQPPAAAVSVVQPPHGQRDGRQQDRQFIESVQDAWQANNPFDNGQDNANN